ncbi:MAG: chemotaxis protein CheA [Synergistales bacterium]|nr:chemotaxis protein CheA [Synergistales bacterium]MDY6402096.1 chemotaxis protein CheA [Synergistales bacterium]MDY6405243.1 chemotaxis protein CheA [Synergistales bacterium]MDY6410419.1 chemotaxis protein CheA [Synergistales bacterium]MDY6413872.1 chemotaxis protein CheA [Synergistales bacterium]
MDMSQYLGAFLDETDDNVQRLDDFLLALEKNMVDMDVINEIFRAAHTLKGMAGTMGFTNMMGLTHAMEDRLDAARKGTRPLTENDMNLLFKGLDTLQEMADTIRGGGNDAHIDVSDLVAQLRNTAPAPAAAAPASVASEAAPASGGVSSQDAEWVKKANQEGSNAYEVHVTLSQSCLLKAARAYMVVNRLEEMGEIYRAEPSTEALEKEEFEFDFKIYVATPAVADEVKATIEKIGDVQSAEVTEVKAEEAAPTPAPAQVQQAVAPEAQAQQAAPAPAPAQEAPKPAAAPAQEAPKPAAAPAKKDGAKKGTQTVRVDIGRLDKLMNLVGELVISRARIERLVQEARLRQFDETLSQLGRISGDIQELVTKLRMVPVSFTFDRFPRLIRDLCKTLNKNVELVLEGEDTELDRTVIDEIGDPMVHLIRNSMDHGIEHPEERKAMGKPEKGILKIAAYQEGSGVVIEVSDDGAGIDPERVKQKAIERGIITEDRAAIMSDDEATQIVLLPGFSMAKQITDLSGRGVGMDAVKTKVEQLGGQFDLVSKKNEGTHVYIRLPLTLAIVLSLLIKVGEETYAISLENVEETIMVRKEDIKTVHGEPTTLLRGEVLSLNILGDILGTEDLERDRDEYPVVVVKIGKNKIGFIVSQLIGQQEIVIKSLGKFLAKIDGITGGTILGDGNVALILDVASFYSTKG